MFPFHFFNSHCKGNINIKQKKELLLQIKRNMLHIDEMGDFVTNGPLSCNNRERVGAFLGKAAFFVAFCEITL